MAIVKKRRKSGRFVWYLDERIQGRRVIRSLKTDDKQIARERYHVLAARLHREEDESASRKTSIAGLRERVIEYIGATRTEKYQKQFVFAFNFLEKAFPPSTGIGAIDRSSLDEFRVMELANVKPNTINAYFRALRTAYNLAMDWELIDKNPFAKLGELKDSSIDERDKYFSDEEMRLVLNGLDDSDLPEYFRPAVELSLYCGLRLSEVLTLTPNDVKDEQLLVRGKGNKVRSIPFVAQPVTSPWVV
jgi:integrase